MSELRVLVITGASAGIGEQLALIAAASKSYRLALVARRSELLQAVTAKCTGLGAECAYFIADLTDRQQVNKAVAAIVERFGTIDVWVNNAGQGIFKRASELVVSDIEDMMKMNVYTALFSIQAVLPIFKEKKEGLIVNVSSLLGRNAELAAPRSAYSGAKHFLNGLIGSLRAELAQDGFSGIILSIFSPGIVKTDFGTVAGGPDSRQLPGAQEVEEVASILFNESVVRRKSEVYTSDFGRNAVLKYIQNTVDVSNS
jgi:short-subunit dehydrogenase